MLCTRIYIAVLVRALTGLFNAVVVNELEVRCLGGHPEAVVARHAVVGIIQRLKALIGRCWHFCVVSYANLHRHDSLSRLLLLCRAPCNRGGSRAVAPMS